MKGSKIVTTVFIMMAVVLLYAACIFIYGNENPMEAPDTDVPENVLAAATAQVERLFEIARTDYPDHDYTAWRIESLTHAYAYSDLNGMRLAVYQMNYEFLTESPERVVLAGGMYITDDNWVMPGYPNSTYLIFRQDGDRLDFLRSIVENDCTPGTQLFTDDLLAILAQ